MHRSICRSSFLVPILALSAGGLLLSTVAAADSIEVTERFLTLDAAADYNPAISGTDVVFTSHRGGMGSDILGVDSHLDIFLVAVGPGEQTTADIDGTNVVYVDYSLANANIAMVDLTNGESRFLTFDGGNDTAPAISGDNVVFVSTRGGTTDILHIDVETLTLTNVATTSGYEAEPAISGSLVAWQVHEGGSWNIYATQLGGISFPVAVGPGDETGASVSGNLIAYIVDGDVAIYDYSTGQTAQITADPFTQRQVIVDGRRLVWVDDRNGNDDIFLHALVSGKTFQLTTDPSDQNLGDFEGNRVVFDDNRFGDYNVWQVEFTIIPDVPSLSFPGMALLAGLLVGVGAWLLRRQRVLSS